MGLFDRLAKKLTPDYHTMLQAALEPDDTLIAYTSGFPHGYHRASRSRGIDQVVINKIIDTASNRAAAKHTTGDDGSIARRIPLGGDLTFLTFSTAGLGFWNLGITGREQPETILFVPREAVTGFTDTGQRAQGGATVAQIDFADKSGIAYRLTSVPDDVRAAMAALSI